MDLKIEVKAQDMEPQEYDRVRTYVYNAFTNNKTETTIAAAIKKDLDSNKTAGTGAGWNVVVGKNFGSHVFYQTKKYVYLNIADQYVLIWKS